MRQKHHLFFWVTLMLILSLLLVACERPVPESGDTTQEPTTETDAATNADTSTQAEETGTTGETGTTSEEPANTSEDSTPRVDTDEAASGETAEDTSTDETTTSTGTEEATETADESMTETEPAVEVDATDAVEATQEESSEASAEVKTAPATHTVAAGETLYRIGLKYNVSWVTLAEFNGLANANQIKVGQVLNIPGETAPKVEATPSPLTETTYAVKAGDNLYRIGLTYGISWVQIAEANGLVSPNQIIVGQVLKIPVDTPGPTPQFTHQVTAGETLLLISLQYGVSWPSIADANNISSPYVIFTGQTLVIPGG